MSHLIISQKSWNRGKIPRCFRSSAIGLASLLLRLLYLRFRRSRLFVDLLRIVECDMAALRNHMSEPG